MGVKRVGCAAVEFEAENLGSGKRGESRSATLWTRHFLRACYGHNNSGACGGLCFSHNMFDVFFRGLYRDADGVSNLLIGPTFQKHPRNGHLFGGKLKCFQSPDGLPRSGYIEDQENRAFGLMTYPRGQADARFVWDADHRDGGEPLAVAGLQADLETVRAVRALDERLDSESS